MGPTKSADFTTARGHWIMMGAGLATYMWFNVWFIIWPCQRKIIGGIKAGTPAAPEIVKRATLASKINVYSSIPMLFAMLAAGGHFIHDEWYWYVGVLVVGFVANLMIRPVDDRFHESAPDEAETRTDRFARDGEPATKPATATTMSTGGQS